MYSLKQVAKLARDQLMDNLQKHDYYSTQEAHYIWAHKTRRTKLFLYVDDFRIEYFSQDDTDHLIKDLRTSCDVAVDTQGTYFYGLTLKWNYSQGYVDVSMPEYVVKLLLKLGHIPPTHPQHAPYKWTPIRYGK